MNFGNFPESVQTTNFVKNVEFKSDQVVFFEKQPSSTRKIQSYSKNSRNSRTDDVATMRFETRPFSSQNMKKKKKKKKENKSLSEIAATNLKESLNVY